MREAIAWKVIVIAKVFVNLANTIENETWNPWIIRKKTIA